VSSTGHSKKATGFCCCNSSARSANLQFKSCAAPAEFRIVSGAKAPVQRIQLPAARFNSVHHCGRDVHIAGKFLSHRCLELDFVQASAGARVFDHLKVLR